jgi:uncharacterized protein (DUF362 family)/Pyruvate/2-oxoacid:ferredoxin oxidoreductase delta subunit
MMAERLLQSVLATIFPSMALSPNQTSGKNKTPSIVAVIHCPSYDSVLVENAVKRGIALVGGIAAFAKKNENLLFKPNVLAGTDPAKCVVTHPAVLRAAVCAFTSAGPHLRYGDSPLGLSEAESTMKKCGYDKALTGLPVTLAPFEKSAQVHFPEGRVCKRLTIAQPVLDADAIINLPKLKTHELTRMTGAIKNCFGCVPMLLKSESHVRFPDVYVFSQMLVDIAAFVRPRLHIMDAIEAMEGNGPQSGTPKKLGAVLVSADPVALDVIACKLIGLDPAYVPTIAAAEKTGLGWADSSMIRLVGDAIEPLIDPSFDVVRMPPVAFPQPTALGTIKRSFLPRPVINKRKCTRCGQCVSICPLKLPALSQKSKIQPPRYDYRICIRCYCCQEACPSGAISVKKPLLRKLLPCAAIASRLFARLRAGQPRTDGSSDGF